MPGSNRIMKHTVLSSGLHDADIRPPALMSELMRLSVRDATRFFGDARGLEKVECPACSQDDANPAFEKNGFAYVRCGACQSLYVSPRPNAELLSRYYAESEASSFRTAQFTQGTASQRRFHQWRSNASWIAQLTEELYAAKRPVYADIQNYSPFIFDEMAELGLFSALYSIDSHTPPLPSEVGTITSTALSESPPLDVVSAFEKLEHEQSPFSFLKKLHHQIAPNGLLFLTTRTCSGFDLQVLGGKAPYIYVPEHLNLMSIAGLEQLVQRSGFELVELSTPGQLDVELVLQACAEDPSIKLPPFARALLTERGPLAHGDFQAFLQKHHLSSHVRIAARKRG